MTRKITIGVILTAVIGLVGWDVYVAMNSIPGDTISEILFRAVHVRPVLAFAFGFVCGHLFWGQSRV